MNKLVQYFESVMEKTKAFTFWCYFPKIGYCIVLPLFSSSSEFTVFIVISFQ